MWAGTAYSVRLDPADNRPDPATALELCCSSPPLPCNAIAVDPLMIRAKKRQQSIISEQHRMCEESTRVISVQRTFVRMCNDMFLFNVIQPAGLHQELALCRHTTLRTQAPFLQLRTAGPLDQLKNEQKEGQNKIVTVSRSKVYICISLSQNLLASVFPYPQNRTCLRLEVKSPTATHLQQHLSPPAQDQSHEIRQQKRRRQHISSFQSHAESKNVKCTFPPGERHSLVRMSERMTRHPPGCTCSMPS